MTNAPMTERSDSEPPQTSDSRMAMWRGAIALAWVDGTLDAGEKIELSGYFNNNAYLSDEQRARLMEDLEQGVQLKDVWDDITDKEDRANLIDIATTIFWANGSYSPTEHEVYDKMFADHMATIDVEQVKKEVHAMAVEMPDKLKKEEQNYVKSLTKIQRLIYNFEKMTEKWGKRSHAL